MTEPFYSFDTSAFINGRRDHYPPDVFPSFWRKVEESIVAGFIRSADEVRSELGKKDDTTKAWTDTQADLYLPLEEDIQRATGAVLGAHPKLMGSGGGRNGADPFVIGLAIARGGVVVTLETKSGRIERPRIPDVCEALGVRCIPLVQVAHDLGWAF